MKRILLPLMLCSFAFGAFQANTTIGYSWTRLNHASYHAIEIGTSTLAITKSGMVRPYTGAEISVPLFFDTNGSNLDGFEEKGSGFGVGLQVPLVFGLDIAGFYIQGMAGYNLNWFSTAMSGAPSGAQLSAVKKAKTNTISHGYIYGGGIGYNFSSNFTIGIRYIRGSMQNKVQEAVDGEIFPKYKTNYEKIYALIGYKF